MNFFSVRFLKCRNVCANGKIVQSCTLGTKLSCYKWIFLGFLSSGKCMMQQRYACNKGLVFIMNFSFPTWIILSTYLYILSYVFLCYESNEILWKLKLLYIDGLVNLIVVVVCSRTNFRMVIQSQSVLPGTLMQCVNW